MNGLKLGAFALLSALTMAGFTGCSDDSPSTAKTAVRSPAPAGPGARTGVSVTGAEIRVPTTPDVTAGYLTITNTGPADTLTGVSTSAAAVVEMHRMVMNGNSMTMKAMENVEVPANSTVRFAKGEMHLMLMKPKALKVGQEAGLTLHFTTAGDITVPAKIVPVTGAAP
ncbi:copper chaperone PCu(A)C [Actinomadura alba]|uniref:Copper chaperone PCu(A)C n=1 Tax=Actinomadura alba TaxID=406431 RepID=A0ABR7LNQ6_9ACTN|nr:copper chaperone PCu(A)C [Actinomadura alba]MBC6466461.1 copper chaperone PCu(A)C [Actinomadura alba]